MPRYFFDIDTHECDSDEEGAILENDQQAKVEAIFLTGEYNRNNPEPLNDGHQLEVVVRREDNGQIVRIVTRVSG